MLNVLKLNDKLSCVIIAHYYNSTRLKIQNTKESSICDSDYIYYI